MKGVNEFKKNRFPSSKRRGGCAAGADGVVIPGQLIQK